MEVPLSRVVTMIVFGLLRKGLITFQEGSPPRIYAAPKPEGVRPYYYELMFLKTLKQDGTISSPRMKRTLSSLIQTVARKLEGYSRSQTRTYYQRVMQRAVNQLSSASTPSMQSGAFDKYAEWLLVEPQATRRMREYDDYHVPWWYYSYYWHFHRPYYRPRRRRGRTPVFPSKPPSASKPDGKGVKPPTIPEIADGIATGTSRFTDAMVVGFAGMADGIARKFAPPPPRPKRSTYSGRSSSCACACACVSCACACAGGGR